jgi:dihydrofolate synthase/folylpolyglutamate synthase
LQRLTRGPLTKKLPPGWELWLDGAHNPHGARALAAWLAAQKKPAHLVTAMLDSKDPIGFFEELKGHIGLLRTVPVPGGHSGLDPVRLAETAVRAGHKASSVADPAAAIAEIVAHAGKAPAIVMIAGSLYLAGAILAENA